MKKITTFTLFMFFIMVNIFGQTNEQKARALQEALATGDPTPLDFVSDTEYTQHNLSLPNGKQALAGFYTGQSIGITVDIHRSIEVGDYVMLQTTFGGSWGMLSGTGSDQVVYDVWRFENGLMVEHWDNITNVVDDMDGTTQTDGSTTVTDLASTDANQALLEDMTQTLFVDGDWTNVDSYFNIQSYIQHSVGAGTDGAFLASLQGQTGVPFYEEVKFIHTQGNFGLVMSQGPDITGQDPDGTYAYYDLFRMENGLIVEHWDVIQEIPDQSQWANNNGKWGDDAIQVSVGTDITLRNTLQDPGAAEATYASLFGAADNAFDEFAVLSNTEIEFATALAQGSATTGLPFDISGLYEIDFTQTGVEFTLLPDDTDPFWIQQFGVFQAGKFDRYYFTFSEPHNITSAASNDASVNLRIDSDTVIVVELSEGYNFNPGMSFFINFNMADGLTNEQKARGFNEGLQTGNPSALKWMHSDYIQHNLTVPTGKAGVAAFYTGQPIGLTIDINRSFQAGDYVFAQTTFGGSWGAISGSGNDQIIYDVWRFENGFAVEHWDNIGDVIDDMDGTTQTDGVVTPVSDLASTAANQILLEEMSQTLFVDGDWTNVADYFDLNNFVQHSVGAGADGAFLTSLQGQTGVSFYDDVKFIHTQGNFGLVMSQGPDITGQDPDGTYAYYDLFRMENGLIVEHWDIIEEIPTQDQWVNNNGKWGDDAVQISVGTDITLRNTLQDPGAAEATYASLFGAADNAFDEFAVLSNTEIEFATALAQGSATTGLPFDISGLYEIDFNTTSIDFTLLPDDTDPFWIQQFGVFPAGKFDRYYFTFSEPHNITNYSSSNSSVSLRIDSDHVVVVEISEGYDFNPGQAFTINLNPPAVDVTLRNTLQDPGAAEVTYASLFGAADDAFDEFAIFSNIDVEYATALAQGSATTGLPFDISGLYEIDLSDNSIDFTLLPDATDPFWIQQFGVFPAGKFDRYYLTYSEPHNITNFSSSNSSVSLRIDSDHVVVVEISEGYDFNPGQAFTINLNPPEVDVTLRNTLEEGGMEMTYASLFGAADDAFDEFAQISNTEVEFATALAQSSATTGLPFDISGLYEIDLSDNSIEFTLLPDSTDPFWVQQFGVFPAGKVDRYYFTFSEPHNITSFSSSNSSVNLRIDSDHVVVVEINEGYDFNPGQAFIIDLNPSATGVDLNLNLDVVNQLYNQWSTVDYILTVTNEGNVPATNIEVDATFPSGLVYSTHNTNNGNYELFFNNWTIPTLAAGETATLNLQLFTLIGDQNITYFAEVVAQDQPDSDSTPGNGTGTPSEDDEASVTISPQSNGGTGTNSGNNDLELSITTNNNTYNIYDVVTYTISVTNNGPEVGTGIIVNAGLPNGLVYSNASATNGEYNGWFEEWTIDLLEAGQTAILELDLFILMEADNQPVTNFVQIFVANEQDPDSTPGNNSTGIPAEDDEASVTIQITDSSTLLSQDKTSSNLKNIEIQNDINHNNNWSTDTGLFENKIVETTAITFAPNPFNHITNFKIQSPKGGKYLFQVFDISGKEVSNQTIELIKGTNRLPFDGSHLTNGMYNFRFSNSQGFVSGKMIIVE